MSRLVCTVYEDGTRVSNPQSLAGTKVELEEEKRLAWIELTQPEPHEIRKLADAFDLHPLAVEDALLGHQRAKLERYGPTLFAVLRPAQYHDAAEEVDFGEIHLFIGTNFAITIVQGHRFDLQRVRERLDRDPTLVRMGPQAILYAVLDFVVDGYAPVVAGVEKDIDEIEDQIFDQGSEISQRIYELAREVLGFQRAIHPLVGMIAALQRGFDKYAVDVELRRSITDVLDHVLLIDGQVETFRTLLQNALTANATLVSQRENEIMRELTETSLAQNTDMKRISSWAAIIVTPTLVGSIYGMNFDHMPELHWRYGYPLSLIVMFGMAIILYISFRRRDWL